ncbi:Anthranilate synthase component II [Dendrobium catenatum]|uniref:Anthranilate synthase component II n=1 Tax=Dendrobium catenatum TaxID=906689 RepID=A0A2I0WDR5_9ASPA|nr:Anthranilate synthase component II [Dendrobium catenatum]
MDAAAKKLNTLFLFLYITLLSSPLSILFLAFPILHSLASNTCLRWLLRPPPSFHFLKSPASLLCLAVFHLRVRDFTGSYIFRSFLDSLCRFGGLVVCGVLGTWKVRFGIATVRADASFGRARVSAEKKKDVRPIIVIDNYDSFTYNLCQNFLENDLSWLNRPGLTGLRIESLVLAEFLFHFKPTVLSSLASSCCQPLSALPPLASHHLLPHRCLHHPLVAVAYHRPSCDPNIDVALFKMRKWLSNAAWLDTGANCKRQNVVQLEMPLTLLTDTTNGAPQDSGISLQTVVELGPSIPLFGVCMGLQCIGEAFGGKIVRSPSGVRHGKSSLVYYDEKLGEILFDGLSKPIHWIDPASPHETGPAQQRWNFSASCSCHGVQFHPESIITPDGKMMILNFIKFLDKFQL